MQCLSFGNQENAENFVKPYSKLLIKNKRKLTMTVKELIEYLQTLKQDAEILITSKSSYGWGEVEQEDREMSPEVIHYQEYHNTYLIDDWRMDYNGKIL